MRRQELDLEDLVSQMLSLEHLLWLPAKAEGFPIACCKLHVSHGGGVIVDECTYSNSHCETDTIY